MKKICCYFFSAVAFNSQHQFFFSHIGNALLKWRLISITQFLYDPWISGLIKQRQSCLVTHEFMEDNYKSIIFTRLVSVSYSCSCVPMGDWLQHPTHYRDTKICGQWSHLSKILQYLYTACSYSYIGFKSFLYYLSCLIKCTYFENYWKYNANTM